MAKVYYQRDEKLIRSSKILDEHPLLLEVFEKYPELEDKELVSLSKEIQLFFSNIYAKVKQQAIAEWKVDYSKKPEILDDKNKINCELCNHPIKKVCYIKNNFNGNILKVGSECVKHFEFKNFQSVESMIQERAYIKRLEKLDNQIPNIERVIEQWNLIIQKQPIYIPLNRKSTYLSILDEVKELYNDYIKKKSITNTREYEIIERLKTLLISCEKEKGNILRYVDENENNKLAVNKEYIDLLKRIKDNQGLKWIDEDEKITSRTLFRLNNKELAKKIIDDFNVVLKTHGIKIISAVEHNNKLGYNISILRNPNVKLFCEFAEFAMNYGGIVTDEELFLDINQNEMISMGKFIDMESIDFALGRLQFILSKYELIYDEYYPRFDEVLWCKYKNGREHYYILTDLKKLNVLLKDAVFDIDNCSSSEIFELIRKNSTTMGNKDAEEFKKNRNRMMA